MKLNPIIHETIIQNNNIITTSQVLSLGFSKTLLTMYVKEGLLERCRHGIYTLPNTEHDSMYTLMLRSENIIFSHETALFLNGITTDMPEKYTITIPTNTSLPNSLKGECNCFYVKPEIYIIGLTSKVTPLGNRVRCYDAERTICDLLRTNHRIDNETVINAMKNYVLLPNKNLSRLAIYAVEFNVQKTLNIYMGILL